MLWIIATPSGREFDVQEQIEALGLDAIVPRRVDMIRQGKRRKPDPVTSAYLPGYAFAWFGDDDWHAVKEAKGVISMLGVSPQPERLVRAFIARVEADYATRMAQIEVGERVSEYNPGDLLQIMTGEWAGHFARFERMSQYAREKYPMIEAEMHDMTLMGRGVKARLDPIAVKRATP